MLRPLLTVAAAVTLAATNAIAAEGDHSITIRFEDVTARSGVNFVADSRPSPNKNQPERMISGVAIIDYDNDGYADLFFINGAAIPPLKKASPKYYNRLYHNNHD